MECDIHHFTVQSKMASITEEFSGECLKGRLVVLLATVSLFSCPLVSSASIFNGKLPDSVSTAGDALLMFAFSTSKGLPAGGKSAGFSREKSKIADCSEVDTVSLRMIGDTGEVSGSIFGCSKSNGRFAGGKREGFSRGRDVCLGCFPSRWRAIGTTFLDVSLRRNDVHSFQTLLSLYF